MICVVYDGIRRGRSLSKIEVGSLPVHEQLALQAHPPRLRSTLVVVAADAMLPKAAAAGMAGVAAVADRPVVEVAVGRRVLVIAVAMDRPEGVAAAAGMDHPTACIGVEDSHPAVAAAAELAFWWAWHQAGAIVARCGPSWAHRA